MKKKKGVVMAPPDSIWHKESLKFKEIFGTREGFEICPNNFSPRPNFSPPLYGKECHACMPMWRILQMRPCVCGRYNMCTSICDHMQPRASMSSGLCDSMHACVADHAVPAWQIMPLHACLWGKSNLCSRLCDYKCGRYNLCSRMCGCMHAGVTDYANVSTPVWQVQPA